MVIDKDNIQEKEPPAKQIKAAFFGAGVLGSLYAARLHEAGTGVTLVARGARYAEIKEQGIVLENFATGSTTTTEVRVLDDLPPDEFFDVCVVLVQKTQLPSALFTLKKLPNISAFLFMVNTAEGPQAMIDAVGEEKVLLGHANAGGERDGPVVRYITADKITLGELDGKKSPRLLQIAGVFKGAGFPVSFSRNIDAWKRYHVALVGPFANALYMAGSCNYRLARNREGLRKGIHGIREAFQILRANGFPAEPPILGRLMALPDFILLPLFRRVVGTRIMDIGGARHARNAREEMIQLNEELFALADKAGVETPVLKELHRYSDPSVPPAINE